MDRVTLRIETELLKDVDAIVEDSAWPNRSEVLRQAVEEFVENPPAWDQQIAADGSGISESFDEFADPETDPRRVCISCGDVVEREHLVDGECPGCRYGGESSR